jgi:hypothetical protein
MRYKSLIINALQFVSHICWRLTPTGGSGIDFYT